MALSTVVLLLSAQLCAHAEEKAFAYHYDHVLGTSLDVTIMSDNEETALVARDAMLEEIERLNAILNLYDPSSEISQVNAIQQANVSKDLLAVLKACEKWRVKTDDHFSCLVGKLLKAWKAAEANGVEPDKSSVRRLADAARDSQLMLPQEPGMLNRPADIEFATNGLAKGYIIDLALANARKAAPDAAGMMLNIGGDMRFFGNGPSGTGWRIGISDPLTTADNAAPLTVLTLASGAVATSGGQKRGYSIAGKRYSHIVSPRTGWVAQATAAASVVAPSAQDADALATAFNALPIRHSLRLANSLEGVEALLATEDGRQFASAGWRRMAIPANAAPADNDQATAVLPTDYALTVSYEVPKIEAAKYRPPYLAIWVTDERKKLVTVLALLGSTKRWQEENYVWHRRYGRKDLALVDAVSEPTRMPGQYQFVWDGVDDYGLRRRQGSYTLNIETAREYGDHKLIRMPLDLADQPLNIAQEADGEAGTINVTYGVANR